MEDGNFQGKVEWRDNGNWSEWEPVTTTSLTEVVSRNLEALSQESDLITAEIFNELSCNSNLSFGLMSALRDAPHGAFDEEVKNCGIMQNLCCLSHNGTEHKVPLLVFQRVVQTMLGNRQKTVDERFDFRHISIGASLRNLHHGLSSHWIDKVEIFRSALPLTANEVHALVLSAEVIRINGGECLKVLGERAARMCQAQKLWLLKLPSEHHWYLEFKL